MITQIDIITYATAAVVLTGWGLIFAYVGLKGWNGWLALKHTEIELTARHAAVARPGAALRRRPHRPGGPQGAHPQAGSDRLGGGSLSMREGRSDNARTSHINDPFGLSEVEASV